MCFGVKDRKRTKTNHCVIVLLDDTQLVHELHVSTNNCTRCWNENIEQQVNDREGEREIICIILSENRYCFKLITCGLLIGQQQVEIGAILSLKYILNSTTRPQTGPDFIWSQVQLLSCPHVSFARIFLGICKEKVALWFEADG